MVLLCKLLPAGSGRAGSGQVVSRICSRYQQKHATRATTTTTTTSTARAGASLHWVVMVAKVAHPRGARSARGHLKKGPRFEEFGWLHGALLLCCKIVHI